jgi:hypothetical protein
VSKFGSMAPPKLVVNNKKGNPWRSGPRPARLGKSPHRRRVHYSAANIC